MRLENSYLSQPLVSPLLDIHKLESETETHENQTENHERGTLIRKQEAERGSGGFKSLLSRAQQLRQQERQQDEEEGAVSQLPSPSSEKSEQPSPAASESSPVLDLDVECELREKLPSKGIANVGCKKLSSDHDTVVPCVTNASGDDGISAGKPNGRLDEFHLAVRKRRVEFENSIPLATMDCDSGRCIGNDKCSQSNPELDARKASISKEVTSSQHQEKRSLDAAAEARTEASSPAVSGQPSEASAVPQPLKLMTDAQLRLEILQQKLREQREKAEHECAELMSHGTSAGRCSDVRPLTPACDSWSTANASVADGVCRSKKSAEQELKELETKLRIDLDVYLTPLVRSQQNKHDLRYVPEAKLLESFSSSANLSCSCEFACEICRSSGNGIMKDVQFRLDHQKDTNCRDNRPTNCVFSIPACTVHKTTSKYDRKNLYLHLNSNHNNNNDCSDKNKASSDRKNIFWSDQNSCMAKEIDYGKQNLWQTDDGSDKKTSSSSEGSLYSLNFSKKVCSPIFTTSKFLPGCSSPSTEKFPCLNSTSSKTEGLSPVTNGSDGGTDYVRRRQRSGYSPRLFRCDCANCIEIEASESCKWLRAAGFPQYAQMYEELRFPLDLAIAERDHNFLEPESLNALFRRLKILNRCARIRLDHQAPNKAEESEDEEQQCALSSNWLFERHSGRWSRVGTELEVGKMLDVEPPPFKRSGSERIKDSAKALLRRMESMKAKKKRKPHREGGSLQISGPLLSSAAAIENRVAELGCIDLQQGGGASDVPSRGVTAPRHRSLSRHTHSQGEDSSSLTSDQSQNSTPLFRSRRRKRFLSSKDDACARGSDPSDLTGGKSAHSMHSGKSGGGSSSRSGESGKSCDSRGSDAGAAFSDSECSLPTYRSRVTPCDDDKVLLRGKLSSGGSEDSYCRHTPLQHSSSVNIPHGLSSTPPTKEQMLINNRNKLERRASPPPSPDDERHSIYDNVPIIICNRTYQDYRPDVTMDSASTSAREGSGSSECCTADSRGSPCPSNTEQDAAALITPSSSQHLDVHRPKRKNTVERWHSFNDGHKRSSGSDEGMHISHFSAGQMLILRKRALLRLTALMEHHCPSRPTWNWELPKFMTKRFRPSENKTNINSSNQVFGVALHVTQRKTGYPLPPVITDALRYLDQSCSDQVGLFRKPGVRSRIQKLRELIDQGEVVDFATYGAYDVADMVKTYFRELPEVLLTNKLSEVFLTIFHYLPETDRMEAMQCALLMLPDENREALMTLLTFLDKMASNSHLNQMTASNLAVCLAPSLFHLCMGGPLRRKNVSGSPEQKDLNDNKAAHVCLQIMIQKVHLIDFIGADMLSQISFTYLETSQPVHVEDLGMTSSFCSSNSPSLAEAVDGTPSPQHSSDWAAYMDSCIAALIKEVKEKNRAYVSLSSPDPDVEVIYRKVGDGHPLRLWKVTTEVEAPPAELLNRVLQERHLWDDTLAKWRTIARLDRQSDVWQYLTKSMLPKPSNDFCVLRCWRSDMGRVGGSCALVETSVEHPDAKLVEGCTRGIVLVSRYFIQPCGSGKSRVTHVSRIDLRGRSPEWYNKNYGALAARKLAKLRDSFKHFAEGPESKV